LPIRRLTKLPPREQEPEVRNKNFFEVSQGYDAEMAMDEAKRCLNCKHKPCVAGCPVNVKIPEFIQLAAEGKFLEAYEVIRSTNALPAVCGRVCPQETQCEEKCVRGIKGEPVAIGRLERFVADYAMEHGCEPAKPLPDNGKKIAIVGAGPAGLTCAGDLRKLGYEVTIFEALHTPGGVLVYGIPEFRLPKQLVRDEFRPCRISALRLKPTWSLAAALRSTNYSPAKATAPCSSAAARGFRAFRDSGRKPKRRVFRQRVFNAHQPDEGLHLPQDGYARAGRQNVAVVGGGNVAMDAARSAKRLGAENVYIVYRRSETEMPARVEEVHHAKEEGIIFRMLTNPTEILGDENGHVTGMTCVVMELGEPDASGRRKPVVKPGSEYHMDVDTVVIAIGNSPNPLIKNTTPASTPRSGAASSWTKPPARPAASTSTRAATRSPEPRRSSSRWARAKPPPPRFMRN
jgi:glutamate synthase (NADPH/NADH) small chain